MEKINSMIDLVGHLRDGALVAIVSVAALAVAGFALFVVHNVVKGKGGTNERMD